MLLTHRRNQDTGFRQDGEVSSRKYEFVASTEIVGRDGDLVMLNDVNLRNFRRNPVFLWAHDAYSFPVGRVTRVWMGKNAEGVREMRAMVQLLREGLNPTADMLAAMLDEGAINAVSIRWQPGRVRYPKDADEAARLGLGEYGRIHEKIELIEISAVGIPADPTALLVGKRAFVDNADELNAISCEIPDRIVDGRPSVRAAEVSPLEQEVRKLRSDYESLREIVEALQSTTPTEEPEGEEEDEGNAEGDPTLAALDDLEKKLT